MDNFEKIKKELEEKRERARSKVQYRITDSQSSPVKNAQARARERLASIKKVSTIGSPVESEEESQASNAQTRISEGVVPPVGGKISEDDLSAIKESFSEGSPPPIEIVRPEDSQSPSEEIVEESDPPEERSSFGDSIFLDSRISIEDIIAEEEPVEKLPSFNDSIFEETPLPREAPDTSMTQVMSGETSPDFSGEELHEQLSPSQRHQIDRAYAHLMHSVVKMCFYNLKVFCPSMVDEFDNEVEKQVIANIKRLSDVQNEIDTFFEQTIVEGKSVGSYYENIATRVRAELGELVALALPAHNNLDKVQIRHELAREIPERIDVITAQLQEIRSELDGAKCGVKPLLEEAISLHAYDTKPAIELCCQDCPKIFADPSMLTNAFTELISNAVKYSQAEHLTISLSHIQESQMLEILFEDDGDGMAPEVRKRCFERGFTTGGTGEGLSMVLEYIEVEHLGSIQVASILGHGAQFRILLPVIFQNQSAERS